MSPQRDNGYDVADYYQIDPVFGDMQDVEELLSEAERRGIGIMLDMVFNQGEMSSTSLEHCIKYTNPKEKELTMSFSFHHLKVDYKNGDKWEIQKPDYHSLKSLFIDWQLGMQEADGWNAVFWCNHDQPRIVSRLGDDKKYWKESAKMLATCIHMLRGTPYIYQGEELGMTNAYFTEIEQYRDVESRNYYNIMRSAGKSHEEAIEVLQARSRDNARTPMQWSTERFAGFSEHTPWIGLPEHYEMINVAAEEKDGDSILHYYRELVALRKKEPVIASGDISFLYEEIDEVFAYCREDAKDQILVFNNLSGKTIVLEKAIVTSVERLLGNYENVQIDGNRLVLRPYESVILKRQASCFD